MGVLGVDEVVDDGGGGLVVAVFEDGDADGVGGEGAGVVRGGRGWLGWRGGESRTGGVVADARNVGSRRVMEKLGMELVVGGWALCAWGAGAAWGAAA